MENICVFCGAPIPDGEVYCNECSVYVSSLTPEQRLVLEKITRDVEDREKLYAAICEIKEQIRIAFAPVIDAIRNIIDTICEAIKKED